MTKIYLVELDGQRRIETRNHAPTTFICELPESMADFHPSWINVVNGIPSVNESKKAADLQAREQAKAATAYITGRLSEYPTFSEVMEALIENAEGRPEKLARISALRASVKNKYPKP